MDSQKQYQEIKKSVKRGLNKFEWNEQLDQFLAHSVIRNYFNFEVISLEINAFAKKKNYDFGIANAFTNEKCRLRWSYIHL